MHLPGTVEADLGSVGLKNRSIALQLTTTNTTRGPGAAAAGRQGRAGFTDQPLPSGGLAWWTVSTNASYDSDLVGADEAGEPVPTRGSWTGLIFNAVSDKITPPLPFVGSYSLTALYVTVVLAGVFG